MKIEVRLFGSLAGSGPSPQELELPEGATVAEACSALGLADASSVVALLDGGPAWPETPLNPLSRLDLLPIVDGG